MPMISVVIPLYNKEKSVRATLESVRTQSYNDWECIIVDDGSTDSSRKVAEQFEIEDLRFVCHDSSIFHLLSSIFYLN